MIDHSLLQARLNTRSVFVLHFIFLVRAVGVWLMHHSTPTEDYAKLHGLVQWIPLSPETTWAGICTLASVLGIIGWWRQKRGLYLAFLIFSAWVLITISGTLVWAGQLVPALIWIALSLCVVAEVILAPRGQHHESVDDLAARAGGADTAVR